jgi:site-specific recombinase
VDAGTVNEGSAPPPPDPSHLLDAGNFITRFSAGDIRNRCVRQLQALLVRVQPGASIPVVAEWLEDLSAWVFAVGAVPGQGRDEARPLARLRLFLDALDALPEQKAKLRQMVSNAVAQTHAVRLFTDTGLPTKVAFFSEFYERLARNLLPPPPVGDDLALLLIRVVHDQRAAELLVNLPEQTQGRLFDALFDGTTTQKSLGEAMREAALLLAQRISVLGLGDDVRRRSLDSGVATSPFLSLPRVIGALLDGQREIDGKDAQVAAGQTLAACQRVTRAVYGTLEATGVSVDLVFRLELIRKKLERLTTLLHLIAPPEGLSLGPERRRFLAVLIRGGVLDRSLREHLRQNVRLLAQRVITRAGHGGEHYITRTRAEWHQMISSAAGGGALVPMSALAKYAVGWALLPLFIEGVANSLNYAFVFVLMQLLHWTLATKQPAMTAAALAGALKDGESDEQRDLRPLAELTARTIRSQLAAFIGNLGLVVPVVVVTDLAYQAMTGGGHLLDGPTAEKTLTSLNALHSATIFYAAFTGIFLWASSVVAGTVENWFVYRQLPESIATHRTLRALLGNQRAMGVANFLRDNMQGFAGNISLAFMLGMVPAFASFFGLPLEVRHVTFVTSQVGFAGMYLGSYGALSTEFLQCVPSIFLVLFLNFASSFALAALVALRARGVDRRGTVRLIGAVWRYFRERPLDFVRAPKDAEPAPEGAAPTHG